MGIDPLPAEFSLVCESGSTHGSSRQSRLQLSTQRLSDPCDCQEAASSLLQGLATSSPLYSAPLFPQLLAASTPIPCSSAGDKWLHKLLFRWPPVAARHPDRSQQTYLQLAWTPEPGEFLVDDCDRCNGGLPGHPHAKLPQRTAMLGASPSFGASARN